MKRVLFGIAVAGMLSAVSAAAAPRSTQASIILNAPAGPVNPAWEPRLGDYVTFTSAFPQTLDRYAISIQVLCYQNGALVFATAGLYDRAFLLGGSVSPWLDNGAQATCHADLYYWSTNGQKFNSLASTEFAALGR